MEENKKSGSFGNPVFSCEKSSLAPLPLPSYFISSPYDENFNDVHLLTTSNLVFGAHSIPDSSYQQYWKRDLYSASPFPCVAYSHHGTSAKPPW